MRINKQSSETVFDLLVIIVLLVSFELSVSFTIVTRYIYVGLLLASIICKWFFFKKNVLASIFARSLKTSSIVLLLFVLPLLIRFTHGEQISDHILWIHSGNSWIILVSYFSTRLFFTLVEDCDTSGSEGLLDKFLSFIKRNQFPLIFISFLSSLIPETFYSLLCHFIRASQYHGRWKGSSGNPQVWAIEVSFILLIWLLSRNDLNKFFASRKAYGFANLFSILIASLIAVNLVASASISNFIGLFFASLLWITNSNILCFLAALMFFLFVNCFGLFFLIHNQDLDIISFKNSFGWLSIKLVPRLKLWLESLKIFDIREMNYLIGFGYQHYHHNMLTHTKAAQVHNLFFHNLLMGGLIGVYSSVMLFIHEFKIFWSNRILLAIVIYLISSGNFECGSAYPEVQQMFWIMFPVIIEYTRTYNLSHNCQ